MPSQPASALAAAGFLALLGIDLGLGALALASTAALAGCSSAAPPGDAHLVPEWRLVPEGTALGRRRQFFLYGRRLDSVKLSGPPSVVVEKGEVKPGGRALSLYLTVHPLSKDSLDRGEANGSRELRAETPDTALAFKLKIVDETLPR